MTADGHRHWRERIGAYLLGGLEPEEAAAVKAHLEGCAECRREAEGLAPLRTLLSRADPDQIDDSPRPPARLGRQVMSRIRQERRAQRARRFRLAGAGALATAVLAGAIVAGVALVGSPDQQPTTSERTVSWSAPNGDFQVSATLASRSFGTQIKMTVLGVRQGTPCRVYVRRAGGGTVAAGSFDYWHDEGEDPPALTAAIPIEEAKSILVHAGSHSYVVPIPPVEDDAA
jgi:hypothetical protein